ncbi:hypothetical protein F4819DRAFT_442419 [Hypoxylon fuscum]|nr:hypothetical protein F4819DRAFT_442419 [Hypoxylon fuscum]
MPTPLDNAMRSKSAVLAFSGLVTAALAWSMWGGNIFPTDADPKGDPETWTREELRRFLAAVGVAHILLNLIRNLTDTCSVTCTLKTGTRGSSFLRESKRT